MSNITKFEDVKHVTTEEYFNENRFSIDAFKKKYAMSCKKDETYVEAVKRVCDFVASVESTSEKRKYWSERWFDEIYNDWWHPAGSIMQGAGANKKISLANCNTISLGALREKEEWDSLESIIRNTAYSVAKSAAYRQGVGVDFSRLRPRGSEIINSANESTGAVHWMQFMDQIGYFVGQSGRIPAMLFSISCSHPDVEEFISVKSDRTKIQNANISVHCTNDFYKAVEEDKDWELSFTIPSSKSGDKIYVHPNSATSECDKDENGYFFIANFDKKEEKIKKVVKARDLMNLIVHHMYSNAEPGIQNIDIAREFSNSDYVYDPNAKHDSRIISTNACSEQFLSSNSVCILSSINAGKFSSNPEDYDKELEVIAISINRFLDNVNECEIQYHLYPSKEERDAIEGLRRIGAGMTDVAGWLFKQDVPYGSEKSSILIEDFMKRYTYHLYKSSVALGKEKGSFELFDEKKIKKSPFIKRITNMGIDVTDLRNVTLCTVAPTGTLSLMFRNMVMGYGIEPSFGMYFWKRTRMRGQYEYYFVVPSCVRNRCKEIGIVLPMESDTIKDDWMGSKGKAIAEIINENKSKICKEFAGSQDVSAMDKLNLVSSVSKWVDSSISVTYMLPVDATEKDVYDFVMEGYKKKVKAISTFPEQKMYGIVSDVPFKDLAIKLQEESVQIHRQNFSEEELLELGMPKEEIKLRTSNAPKREKKLDADIYKITVNKENFIVVIGLQGGYPYEVFGGRLNGLSLKIKHKHLKGEITKVSRGKYRLDIGDVEIEDFSQQFSPVEKLLFRSLSLMLRHGIPMEYIVEQLSRSTDDMFSISAAVARVLKRYIKDGQRVSGTSCPSCNGEMVYIDGCVNCVNCGHSKCD
jgi:ribonucleoside-diphosphate reductase alpha chain